MNWPDTGPTLTCPLCRGPLAYWVLQPHFTCHHCKRTLRSNHREVQVRLLVVTVGVWALLSALSGFFASVSLITAALLVGQVLLPIAFLCGWLSLRWLVKLSPAPHRREA